MPQEENWYWIWVSNLYSFLVSDLCSSSSGSLGSPEPQLNLTPALWNCLYLCWFLSLVTITPAYHFSFLTCGKNWQMSCGKYQRSESWGTSASFPFLWGLDFKFWLPQKLWCFQTNDFWYVIGFLSLLLVGVLVYYKLLQFRRQRMLWIVHYTQTSCLWSNRAGQYQSIVAIEQAIMALQKWTTYYKWHLFSILDFIVVPIYYHFLFSLQSYIDKMRIIFLIL